MLNRHSLDLTRSLKISVVFSAITLLKEGALGSVQLIFIMLTLQGPLCILFSVLLNLKAIMYCLQIFLSDLSTTDTVTCI